ncbi:PRC-barrel domain-containing protein [Chloroflexi bacterium TSY]|nr:PRC-barrel domain-containing protein [Chloroflexi bacterium TSY]
MDIPLNADIECIDGHCGRSTYVVLNPTSQVVTHIVVKADKVPHTEYLVTVSRVTQATPDMIKLDFVTDELSAQQVFISTRFIRMEHPPYNDFPFIVWPFVLSRTQEMVAVYDRVIPYGEMAVHRGAKVEAIDGNVGQIDEFLVDPDTGHITHLILGEDSSGKKKEVAIPVSAIKSFGQERIYLNIDKRATSSLPKVPIERRYELALKTEIEKYAERESDLASRVADLESELQEMRAELLATIDDRFETLSEEIDALKQKSL